MVDAHCRPHHFKWVIITNQAYDKMRMVNGYEEF